VQRTTLKAAQEADLDLIVIGGGITGAATARDAALRGLRVLLVEKDDFASGTSSRSSKLIHGGLRYLQTYQFKIVAESLRERENALRIAPHLTHVRPFLYLLYQGYPESKALLNLGLTFYDAASGAWRQRRHQMLSAREVLDREPLLAADGLLGAGMFYDVLTDDARLTIDTVSAAEQSGALLLNHAEATGLVLSRGRARGVVITDLVTGDTADVPATQVVNATGPWTDTVRRYEGGSPSVSQLRPTKGVHIVVRKEDFPLNTAVFLRSPDDGRVVWPTPSLQDDVVYIGTTDTDYRGDLDDVHPDEHDIRYLLNVANATIPDARLDTSHVVGSWAGLRPLVAPTARVSESNTSREHAITEGSSGMLTISGGKLTSNRIMAQQLVDAAERKIRSKRTRSTSRSTPISGADFTRIQEQRRQAVEAGVSLPLWQQWVDRYGANASRIVEYWSQDPANSATIGVRGLTRAEVRYLVEEEMAVTLEDVLVRRTSVFFWDRTGGLSRIEEIASELTGLLGWTDEHRREQIRRYAALVTRHRPYDLLEAVPYLPT
jgi:glycerol-3-phosphate dehydrogenase